MTLCIFFFNSFDIKKVKYLELHSVSFYDLKLLEYIKKSGIPLILGIGGRTKDEIDEKIDFFGDQITILMSGFQSFPSKIEDVNFNKIPTLVKNYPQLRIGYADLSGFNDVNAIVSNDYAYLLGAKVFEKHITTKDGVERVDFQSAVAFDKILEIWRRIKRLSHLLGDGDLSKISKIERLYTNRQKIVVASHDLEKGLILGMEDLHLKMVDNVEGVNQMSVALHKEIVRGIAKDEAITLSDFKID